MNEHLTKVRWREQAVLRFKVLRQFCKYRIPTTTFGATKSGGVALVGPHLEIEHYYEGDITFTQMDRCLETGWMTWLSQNHSIPVSGYELHSLLVAKVIEEIVL